MSLDSDFRRNSCYFHSVQFCYHFLSICCAPYMPLISHSDDDPMLNTYCGGGGGGMVGGDQPRAGADQQHLGPLLPQGA